MQRNVLVATLAVGKLGVDAVAKELKQGEELEPGNPRRVGPLLFPSVVGDEVADGLKLVLVLAHGMSPYRDRPDLMWRELAALA